MRYTRKQLTEDVNELNAQHPDLIPLGVSTYYEHTQVFAKTGPNGAIQRLEVGTPRECHQAAFQYFLHPPRYASADQEDDGVDRFDDHGRHVSSDGLTVWDAKSGAWVPNF